jgi:hypothetical protein
MGMIGLLQTLQFIYDRGTVPFLFLPKLYEVMVVKLKV